MNEKMYIISGMVNFKTLKGFNPKLPSSVFEEMCGAVDLALEETLFRCEFCYRLYNFGVSGFSSTMKIKK